MSILLVTGTSTDVGKTIVTSAVAALADGPVAVCKPAQTGVPDGAPGDLADVLRLAGPLTTLELARYPDPLAPATAARRCGAPLLELTEVADAVDELARGHALTLVEGAGGLLVRVGEWTLLDLALTLDAPVLVVAAAGLGTLNHAELTVRAITAAGLVCPGIVVGSWPVSAGLAEHTNLDDLPAVTGVPLRGVLPPGMGRLGPQDFAAAARDGLGPTLGGRWTAGDAGARDG